jgi:Domain of unknown function (DUF4189)
MMNVLKAALAAAFFAACMAPDAAWAQAPYPCPGGSAGPGERVVGVINSSQPGGGTLLCVSDGPASQPGPPPPPKPVTYTQTVQTSAAYHPSVADVWAVWDVSASDQVQPELFVLSACEKAMGPGCILLGSVEDGTIAMARSQVGDIRINAGRTPKEAKAAVMADCAKDGLRCDFMKSFTAKGWYYERGEKSRMQFYDPSKVKGGLVRKSVGAAAVSNGAEPWSRKVWMSGGHSTFDVANNAAIAQCKKDSKAECQLLASNAHGVIIVGVDSQGNARGFTEQSLPQAQSYMKQKCSKIKLTCTMTVQFNVATPGTQSFDIYPERGSK